MIYLDFAATTPMSEEALQIYSEVARNMYGNSSSLHDLGTTSNQLLETCRRELAKLINGREHGVYFTSGGSESNVLSLQSLINAHRVKGNHLITTEIEHSSLINFFKKLENDGFDVTYLSVDRFGKIDITELENAITEQTILASIHHANSEIGVIQDINQIGTLLKKHHVLFHSDCVQTFGKIPIDVTQTNLDSISISSHKIYGPKGVGAVYINPEVKWQAISPGTTHENGFRAGTVNVPGIAAFVTAAGAIHDEMTAQSEKFLHLRNQLNQGLQEFGNKVVVLEHESDQLAHIVGLQIAGVEGQYSMLEFNRYGLAISTGSACKVGQQAPSKTMLAIGKTEAESKQFIRLSFGNTTNSTDIEKVIEICKNIISQYYCTKSDIGQAL